ncbi:MAG: SprT-like domain-containing protein [Myxococcales bacterium]|nr:SprT-like domain-containing protein [Myxococcales bacterium]
MRARCTKSSVVAVMLVLGGCVPAPTRSCEPRVTGPDTFHAQMLEVWDDFAQSIADPLCVRRIDVVDEVRLPRAARRVAERLSVDIEAGGRAFKAPSGIVVEVALDGEAEMRSVLVHELCHAVSFQHRSARQGPDWPFWYGPADRSSREEAFSQWCDDGRYGVDLLSQVPDLPEEERSANAFVVEEVYRAPEARTPAPEVLLSAVTFPIPGLRLAPFEGFDDEGRLVLSSALTSSGFVHLDPFTGEWEEGPEASQVPVAAPADPSGLESLTERVRFTFEQVDFVRSLLVIPSGAIRELTFAQTPGAHPVLLHSSATSGGVQLSVRDDGLALQVVHDDETGLLTLWAWDLARPER